MIRRLFSEILTREAARYLSKSRVKRERKLIRSVARRMCIESGKPIPPPLRG
jgi:transcriptional regulator GlxA family with amidase domain